MEKKFTKEEIHNKLCEILNEEFEIDDSLEYGARIDNILKDLKKGE